MRAATLVLALVLIGCGSPGEPFSRVDTLLRADGSVERAVHMYRTHVPAAAQDPKLWTKAINAALPPEQWSKPIPEAEPSSFKEQDTIFAAWGTFPSPEALPAIIQVSQADTTRGRLAPKFTKTDYLVAMEYHWEETLTERVTLPEMLRATREFTRLWTDITIKSLAEHFGPVYDFSEAERWAKSEGEDWAEEIAGAIYEQSLDEHWDLEENPMPLAELCRPHGLDLFDGAKVAQQKVLEARFDEFVLGKLKTLVKRKDGQPVKVEVLKTVKNLILGKEGSEEKHPYRQAFDKVLARDFGGLQTIQQRHEDLSQRGFGLNGLGIILGWSRIPYHFSMKVPGTIIETNGRILSSNEAEWSFVKEDAYPRGYPMLCRSLVAQPETQKNIFGREIEPGHDRLVKLVTLIADTPELKEALDTCRKEQTVEPLRRFRRTAGQGSLPQRILRFEELLGFQP